MCDDPGGIATFRSTISAKCIVSDTECKWMHVHNLLCSGIADDARCGSGHINGSFGYRRPEPLRCFR